MKKILSLALALCMIVALFTAAPVKAYADDEVTLTLWSIATESDSSHQAYVDAIAAYEADHPNIKIEHNATDRTRVKNMPFNKFAGLYRWVKEFTFIIFVRFADIPSRLELHSIVEPHATLSKV